MKLLFICTHNRCRSILAEAITNQVSAGRIITASAGSSPQREVHPLSLKYLRERNFPTDGLRSQTWHDFAEFSPDAIITLCDNAAQEACPVWFGHTVQVHWGLSDPSTENRDEQQQHASFHHTIDVLESRIRHLLMENLTALSGPALKHTLSNIASAIN